MWVHMLRQNASFKSKTCVCGAGFISQVDETGPPVVRAASALRIAWSTVQKHCSNNVLEAT